MIGRSTATGLTRREALGVIGGGAAAMLAGGTLAAAEKDEAGPRRKAERNLKLGIFTSVYGELPVDEAARRIRDDGFTGVVCDYAFKDVRFDPGNPDWDVVKKVRTALERNGIEVCGLHGYYNVVDPVEDRRKAGEARIDLLIRNWKRFGSPIISTETGTYNKDSEWVESPDNYTEKGYAGCRAAFERLARAAEKTGAIIAIETYWRNIIDSPARTERLFKDIPSPSLKLTMDPCNYFRNEDLKRMKPMLEEIFRRVGRETVLAHAKDVKNAPNGPDLPAAGLGELDYPLYLRLLAGLDRELFLVLEHLSIKDVARARDFVKARMAKI